MVAPWSSPTSVAGGLDVVMVNVPSVFSVNEGMVGSVIVGSETSSARRYAKSADR